MQGTVWGSLMCTSTIDNLGKQCYENPENLYIYKGVSIPPLGMVDDVICVTSVEQTQNMNELINTFVESKKLNLSNKIFFKYMWVKDTQTALRLKCIKTK